MDNKISEAYDYLKKFDYAPETAVVLGSGLGNFADNAKDVTGVSYSDIPNFPVSTAPGHSGKLIFGRIHGKDILLMQGRFHTYEGYGGKEISVPIRTMKLLGVKNLILTNSAGGVNTSFRQGDLMLITDHINFSGKNPLIGPNDDDFGPRFPDMSDAYDPELQKTARNAADNCGIILKSGVYAWFTGPSYETPAEVRMARVLGADAVGMSTVPETILARHAGLKVLGISFISNMAAGIEKTPLDGDDVIKVARESSAKFTALVSEIIKEIGEKQ